LVAAWTLGGKVHECLGGPGEELDGIAAATWTVLPIERLEAGQELLEALLVHPVVDGVLGGKVGIQRLRSHLHGPGQLTDRDTRQAILFGQAPRFLDNQQSGLVMADSAPIPAS